MLRLHALLETHLYEQKAPETAVVLVSDIGGEEPAEVIELVHALAGVFAVFTAG